MICRISIDWSAGSAARKAACCALLALGMLPSPLSGQTNLDMLQQCARGAADSLLTGYRRGDTICLELVEHPAAWLVERSVLEAGASRGLIVRTCSQQAAPGISIALTSLGIEYLGVDAPDSLQRVAYLSMSAAIEPLTGQDRIESQQRVRALSVRCIDTVSDIETSRLEVPGYEFTRADLPQRSSPGFWSRIIEPAVVLGASVVMVILLFSARSQ